MPISQVSFPMQVIDQTDSRLIEWLRQDARLPAATLARRLGVSRGTVQNRIDRLLKQGVIRGFTIKAGDAMQPGRVRALASIEVRAQPLANVVKRLKGLPEVIAIHSTNGRWDAVAELDAADLASLDRAVTQLRDIPGVTHSETSILLTSY
jgi:DNA-binding Lrp family transcriptional regulator